MAASDKDIGRLQGTLQVLLQDVHALHEEVKQVEAKIDALDGKFITKSEGRILSGTVIIISGVVGALAGLISVLKVGK